MCKIMRNKTLKRKSDADSKASKKMKVDPEKWHQLRSDMVAHLDGASYECLAKYLVPEVKQFITPSWVLEPTYELSCIDCDKKACFIDLEDALRHGWVQDQYNEFGRGMCPDHLPEYLGGETPWDYSFSWKQENILLERFECNECGATAMYRDYIDAGDYEWYINDGHWCPDHSHSGYLEDWGTQVQCCKCDTTAIYENLDEAYEHGWWTNDGLEYCSKHAGEAIRKNENKK